MEAAVNHSTSARDGTVTYPTPRLSIDALAIVPTKAGLMQHDAENQVLRAAAMVIIFFFGYQKWFPYEAQRLIPFISNGPLTFWLYPALGMRGATLFLGVSEWTFGTLLLLGFWSKPAGILGVLGSTITFISTATIIPFMPGGWDVAAGGFPAMTGNVPFLIKDIVLLAVSVYLLKQDVERSLPHLSTSRCNVESPRANDAGETP